MNDETPKSFSRSINDTEWRVCIDTLREHGPDAAKAVLARGATHADGRPARRTTLGDTLRRDPLRRAEWEDAERDFLCQFVRVIHESAKTPDVIRRFDKKTGALVEERTDRRNSNWAALMVLRRYDPKWRERKAVEVNGQIQHDHQHSLGAPTGFVLKPDDIALLPADDARRLLELLTRVEELKLETETNGGNRRELIDAPGWTDSGAAAAEQPLFTDRNETPPGRPVDGR
jgi:hypothetical protein